MKDCGREYALTEGQKQAFFDAFPGRAETIYALNQVMFRGLFQR